MRKQCAVIAAAFGLMMAAVAGTAKSLPARKSHARHAIHRRARKHARRKIIKGGAHREGAVHVRPDGTVVPNGLKPSVSPVPEILKKKGPPQG